MDIEMSFEYLIRKAYNCGRYGVYGADADNYRRYQRVLHRYEEGIKSSSADLTKLAFDAGVETGKIVAYLNSAFDQVKKTLEDNLTDEQYEQLEQFSITLHEPTKAIIERVVRESSELFMALELKVG